jgi:PAS domain S-box-containing protein
MTASSLVQRLEHTRHGDACPAPLLDAGTLIEHLPVGMLVLDAAGRILRANLRFSALYGGPAEAVLGQPVEGLLALPPDAAAQAGGTHLGTLTQADGQKTGVRVTFSTVDCEGAALRLATVEDDADRAQADARFAAIFASSPYGLLVATAQGRIVQANPALCSMFGYGAEELVGQGIETLIPERQRERHREQRKGYLQNPSQRSMGQGRDLTGRRKSGMEFPVEIGLGMIPSDRGAMCVASVVDITVRKRAELQLREANAQLEEFSYVSSHDLRSPIRGVGSLIDFIREDYGSSAPAAVIRNLDRMQERVERMERLIDDLLTYARAGRRSAKVERIELPGVVEDVLKLEPAPADFSVEVSLDCEPFEGARTPLMTVLRNLYSNAIKHRDAQTIGVWLSARDQDEFCVIDVKDDGPGIPVAAQARVFRLFQTLTATQRGSSGLGLAVARRLCEGHGGRVELISSDGVRGSLFRVWWPRFMRSDIDE